MLSVPLAVFPHAAIFSVSLFAILVVLDTARYIGQTLTYHQLLKDGAAEQSLRRIHPSLCLTHYKQELRSDVVLVGLTLLGIYYYHHLQPLPWMLVVLPVLFLAVLANTYLLTWTRFNTIDKNARRAFLTPPKE